MCEADSFSSWPTSVTEWRIKNEIKNESAGWTGLRHGVQEGEQKWDWGRHHLVDHSHETRSHLFNIFTHWKSGISQNAIISWMVCISHSQILPLKLHSRQMQIWTEPKRYDLVVLMELFIWKFSWIWDFIDRAYVRHWDGDGGGSNEESHLDHNVVSFSLLQRPQEILTLHV